MRLINILSSLALIIILAISCVLFAKDFDARAKATLEINRYINAWTKNLPSRFRANAVKFAPVVIEWSLHYNLDPLLIARIVTLESSWRPEVIGSKGEIGLMQIHNGQSKAKYDVHDPEQNIRAGCELMRKCIDDCNGDLKAAIGKYGTGYCTTSGSWLERRWRLYQNDIKNFRGLPSKNLQAKTEPSKNPQVVPD